MKNLYEITGNITDSNTLLINKAEYEHYTWKIPSESLPDMFRVSDDWSMSRPVLAVTQGFPVVAVLNDNKGELSWIGNDIFISIDKWRYIDL